MTLTGKQDIFFKDLAGIVPEDNQRLDLLFYGVRPQELTWETIQINKALARGRTLLDFASVSLLDTGLHVKLHIENLVSNGYRALTDITSTGKEQPPMILETN